MPNKVKLAPSNKKLLMVEDTLSVATLYQAYLSSLDLDIQIVTSGETALACIKQQVPDLILLDLRLPDMTGMDVLKQVHSLAPEVPVIFMTAHGSIDVAVEAMRAGAHDFLIKPCAADRLRVTVSKAIHQPQNSRHDIVGEINQYQGFIGSSASMQKVYKTIDSAASSKASIFITGESGTGKEVCAEAIHSVSNRSSQPFIALNCAAIPKDLIESELFGHVKGAFTGALTDRQGAAELASGGTLFLDELCEMELDLQTKLLRFIQTGTFQKVGSSKLSRVDVRFVCATNKDPWQEVLKGRFREDLYYRLYVIPLHLPPLRERGDDIIEIAYSLLGFTAIEENKQFSNFSDDVLRHFVAYPWPGNVRQLQNVIRNIVVLNQGTKVTLPMLPSPLDKFKIDSYSQQNIDDFVELEQVNDKSKIVPLAQVERSVIERAIELCDGSIPMAANRLDVSASTLYRKLEKWEKERG